MQSLILTPIDDQRLHEVTDAVALGSPGTATLRSLLLQPVWQNPKAGNALAVLNNIGAPFDDVGMVLNGLHADPSSYADAGVDMLMYGGVRAVEMLRSWLAAAASPWLFQGDLSWIPTHPDVTPTIVLEALGLTTGYSVTYHEPAEVQAISPDLQTIVPRQVHAGPPNLNPDDLNVRRYDRTVLELIQPAFADSASNGWGLEVVFT